MESRILRKILGPTNKNSKHKSVSCCKKETATNSKPDPLRHKRKRQN